MKDFIYVEHQHFVTVARNSFRFVNVIDKQERFIPIDDVEYLIFDHERSYFSKKVITVCMRHNIGILFCDHKHSPLTTLVTDYGYSLRFKRLQDQLALNQKTKNRLWRKVVIMKINNQAACLLQMTNQTKQAKNIQLISKQVEDGDPKNREAQAARQYFSALFGSNFKRGRFDDAVNASLNYSYALLRAMIRRELAMHGLEPSIGIHHKSSENPFNLSDDILEPFRPFADAYVYEKIFNENVLSLEIEEKKQLLKLFFEKCIINGKVYSVADAIKVAADSFVSCLDKNSSGPLKLPSFIEVGK